MNDLIILVALYIAVLLYILVVCLFFSKRNSNKRIILFHNAILSVYKRTEQPEKLSNHDLNNILEQITLNYNKIFQNEKESNKTMMLDMLEEIIFYYDAYSNEDFQKKLDTGKAKNVRDFIFHISQYIKEIDPFSALPTQDATLLKNINDALQTNNIEMGKTVIEQLSTGILNKETLIKKQERNNQKATIFSIVGVILTIFFGILSLF